MQTEERTKPATQRYKLVMPKIHSDKEAKVYDLSGRQIASIPINQQLRMISGGKDSVWIRAYVKDGVLQIVRVQ